MVPAGEKEKVRMRAGNSSNFSSATRNPQLELGTLPCLKGAKTPARQAESRVLGSKHIVRPPYVHGITDHICL
jgi:hypothetical protein